VYRPFTVYAAYIAQARSIYASDDLEIDYDPALSEVNEAGEPKGAWVAAWVWVNSEEAGIPEPEDGLAVHGRCVTEEELAAERAILSPEDRAKVDALPQGPTDAPARPKLQTYPVQRHGKTIRVTIPENEPEPPLPQVVITLEGGLVQDILSSVPVDAAVIDYDSEGADLDDITPIPQTPNPGTEDACASIRAVDVMPERVAELWAVIDPLAPARVKLYECGICDCLHPWEFDGDCREDSERYAGPEDYARRKGIKAETIDVLSREERQKADAQDDEPEEAQPCPCSHKGCATMVNPEDPYYATPCGTYCSAHMRGHMKSCEICRGKFEE